MVMMIVVRELMNLQNIANPKEELVSEIFSHAIMATVFLEFIYVCNLFYDFFIFLLNF